MVKKKIIKGGYNKKKPLRVFTAFSGYDSQCMALDTLKEDTNFDYDLVGWSEIDKHAIIAHDALFPQWKDRNYGDISKINWEEVPDFDLFTYSSPCFVAGTKISCYTSGKHQYVNIENIKVGDIVKTHTGNLKKVTEVMENRVGGYFIIHDVYGNEVKCTFDHPFYCENKNTGEREWISAKDITDDYFPIVYNADGEMITTNIKERLVCRCVTNIFVYNLEVEDDHSYIANNFVVHNCTDFSQAGYQKGGEEGSGTRSSLLWECRKAIITKRPKYLLFENVKALVSDKFNHLFLKWVKELESYGYNNFFQVLNAKDYGVPQNRERIFMVSIRKDEDDLNPYYEFPEKINLETKLEDLYEDDVDDKYYMSDERAKIYVKHLQEDYPKDEGLDTEENEGLW